jgi:hypothetical protein
VAVAHFYLVRLMNVVRFGFIAGIAAVAQFGLFVIASSIAFALGDGGHPSTILNFLAAVLGTPLMHIMRIGPQVFEFGHGRWWGDDSNFIMTLAALNALIWGIPFAALVSWRLRRRSPRTQGALGTNDANPSNDAMSRKRRAT